MIHPTKHFLLILLWFVSSAANAADSFADEMHQGIASFRQKNFAEAETHYKRALAAVDGIECRKDDAASALQNLSILYDAAGNQQAAKDTLDKRAALLKTIGKSTGGSDIDFKRESLAASSKPAMIGSSRNKELSLPMTAAEMQTLSTFVYQKTLLGMDRLYAHNRKVTDWACEAQPWVVKVSPTLYLARINFHVAMVSSGAVMYQVFAFRLTMKNGKPEIIDYRIEDGNPDYGLRSM